MLLTSLFQNEILDDLLIWAIRKLILYYTWGLLMYYKAVTFVIFYMV